MWLPSARGYLCQCALRPPSADALPGPLGLFTHLGCPEACGQAHPASVGVAQRRDLPVVKTGSQANARLHCLAASQVSPSGRISGTPSKAVAGAVKETSQGTFAKGVDTKWPETQTVAKGVTSLLPRKSDEIFNFKPPPRHQETVTVPPRG